MLANAPASAFNASFEPTVRRAVAYTLNGQRADGCFPDRVNTDGTAVYAPGPVTAPFADHAIDNMPFATLLVRHARPGARTLTVGVFVQH